MALRSNEIINATSQRSEDTKMPLNTARPSRESVPSLHDVLEEEMLERMF